MIEITGRTFARCIFKKMAPLAKGRAALSKRPGALFAAERGANCACDPGCRLSAKLAEGLTTPPPLRGTSPYTGEALARYKTAGRAMRYIDTFSGSQFKIYYFSSSDSGFILCLFSLIFLRPAHIQR